MLHSPLPPDLNDYDNHGSSRTQTIEIWRVRAALWRQRYTIMLPALTMGALGLIYAMSKPTVYTTHAKMMLNESINQTVRQVGGISGASLPAEIIANASVVLKSEKLAHDVIELAALDVNDPDLYVPRSGLSLAIRSAMASAVENVREIRDTVLPGQSSVPAPTQTPAPAPVPAIDHTTDQAPGVADTGQENPSSRRAVNYLSGGISISRIGQSSAISIGFTSHDPQLAAVIANSYADAYVQDIQSLNASSIGRADEWLQGNLRRLREQARTAATRAEEFSAENQILASADGNLLSDQSVNQLNMLLTEAIGVAANARAVLETYDRAMANGAEGLAEGNPLNINDNISSSLRARLDTYNSLSAELRRLKALPGGNGAQIKARSDAIAGLADDLLHELHLQRNEASTMLTVADERVEALKRSLDEATVKSAQQSAALVRLRALQQEAETLATLYQTTIVRSHEIERQQFFPVSDVRVLSYAQVPVGASGPATMRIVIAAGFLGLLFGLARALRRELREDRLRIAEDVTAESGLRFLGHLPVLPRPKGARLRQNSVTISENKDQRQIMNVHIPVLDSPDSIYAETLRHVILAASNENGLTPPVIGVTTFSPYADRETIALNLAGQIAAARHGRVLLIDADNSERGLTQRFSLNSKRGLSDLMSDSADWRKTLYEISGSGVTLLPAGSKARYVDDDVAMAKLLSGIIKDQHEYDAVVVNVSALYPSARGIAILHQLPSFIIAGEWGRTSRAAAVRALADHTSLRSRCIGVVYDKVNLRKLADYAMPISDETTLAEMDRKRRATWNRFRRQSS